MYILNNREKAVLVTIAKRTMLRYLEKNNYIYIENEINDTIVSNENVENDFEIKYDYQLKSEDLQKIFNNPYIAKSVELLSDEEKSALLFYYVQCLSDKDIGQKFNKNSNFIQKKRSRALEKIRKKYYKLKGEKEI